VKRRPGTIPANHANAHGGAPAAVTITARALECVPGECLRLDGGGMTGVVIYGKRVSSVDFGSLGRTVSVP
jgi:hypothetical protein